MIFRLGLLVAVSIAACAIRKLTIRTWSSSTLPTTCSDKEKDGLDEEEQKVNSINYAINQVNDSPSDLEVEDSSPEFRDPLSQESNNPLLDDNKKEDEAHETQMENNMMELERLLKLAMELEERKVKIEGELLLYYGLKDRKSDIKELQKQLKIKNEDVDMLKITISSMQAERKKLQEEIVQGALMKELEVARGKIKELQRQLQLDANQTKEHLLLLKQEVSGLQAKEEEAVRKEAEIHKKLKAVKDLEVELGELKTKNRELQHEKQELSIKLDVMEGRIRTLTSVTESKMVIKEKEKAHKLRCANEDLIKQVEGLQTNRFSEVEELVYLRWVNACLRYELRNNQTPTGKILACDLNKTLSPKSQENAKQLMLEYAGLDFREADKDPESNFSHPFSPGIEAFDNTSIVSSTSRRGCYSEEPDLNLNLKKLSKCKGGSSAVPSPGVFGFSHRWKDALEAPIPMSTVDGVAIDTSEMMKQEIPESTEIFSLSEVRMQVSSSDSLNSVATSFQLMSKSVQESLKEKYSGHKDRHRLALEREKQIKEKAEKARAEKYVDISSVDLTYGDDTTVRERTEVLPPKLAQIKEKATASHDSGSQFSDSENTITNPPIMSKMRLEEIEKRPPRVPRPPPRPSVGVTVNLYSNASDGIPSVPTISHPPLIAPLPAPVAGGPPCPPDPPGILPRRAGGANKVYRAPELVQFYQTLMKHKLKKDTPSSLPSTSNAFHARSSMIEEIENRSSFLLAVKADVETQGDFVMSLAMEVRAASFSNMEELVSFVIWLDEELSFLVDERAVLKHFDWPEGKADALREAAFAYQDLMKLGEQVTSFVDNHKLTCEVSLKKMHFLLDKVEQSVYALLRTRDVTISRYKEFEIPVDWLLDSGVVCKIKLSSVQLARKYMKRIVNELDALNGAAKEANREFLLLQGVRFAFRVHQFAGGFDAESMKAFEVLRSCVHTQVGEKQ